MKKKVLLKDVASHLSASSALACYGFDNKTTEKRFGKNITETVTITDVDFNYRLNLKARSLKTNETYPVSLVFADIKFPFSLSSPGH